MMSSIYPTFREKDGKLHVDVEYVRWLDEQRQFINKYSLKDIVFYEDFKPLKISEERYEYFRFCGLNNTCFILDGFYNEDNEDYENYLEK